MNQNGLLTCTTQIQGIQDLKENSMNDEVNSKLAIVSSRKLSEPIYAPLSPQ